MNTQLDKEALMRRFRAGPPPIPPSHYVKGVLCPECGLTVKANEDESDVWCEECEWSEQHS